MRAKYPDCCTGFYASLSDHSLTFSLNTLRSSIIKQRNFPIKRKPIILKIWLKIFVWLAFLNSCQVQLRQTRLWHLLYKDAEFLLAYKAVKDLLSNERGCCQTLSNTTRNMVRSQFSKALSMGSALSTCLTKALFSRYFRYTDLWDCYLKMNYIPCWNLRAISSHWTLAQIIRYVVQFVSLKTSGAAGHCNQNTRFLLKKECLFLQPLLIRAVLLTWSVASWVPRWSAWRIATLDWMREYLHFPAVRTCFCYNWFWCQEASLSSVGSMYLCLGYKQCRSLVTRRFKFLRKRTWEKERTKTLWENSCKCETGGEFRPCMPIVGSLQEGNLSKPLLILC